MKNINLNNNIRRASNSGYKNPPTGKDIETVELPNSVKKRIKESNMSEDQYLKMLYFAKYVPSGKRKLNDKDLTKMVITEREAPLTDTQGLRKGGNVSGNQVRMNVNRKPLKNKPLKLTIKNNNSLPNNPDYPSFKNNFSM